MIGPYALACLDMAGTTVRDEGAVDEAFTEALTAAGVDLDSERFASARLYVRDTMGQSKADVFAALLDPEAAERATVDFARAYERIVAAGRVPPMDGALDLFDALRKGGVKVCLTTGFAPSTRDALIESLGWAAHIDLALSPADCGRGRPEPDMIFGAMDRLGVPDAGQVAVVGDTTSDLEAGTRAGARAVIGVLSGAHDEATLSTAPHTDLIDDITELIGVLSRH
ncbi:MAG TPA: phosphonatase-like hydrolase [Acidimicrobiales bacterium]|nr:phosphonatase-like hydrolase [Acidimicrobiales bacterium]